MFHKYKSDFKKNKNNNNNNNNNNNGLRETERIIGKSSVLSVQVKSSLSKLAGHKIFAPISRPQNH